MRSRIDERLCYDHVVPKLSTNAGALQGRRGGAPVDAGAAGQHSAPQMETLAILTLSPRSSVVRRKKPSVYFTPSDCFCVVSPACLGDVFADDVVNSCRPASRLVNGRGYQKSPSLHALLGSQKQVEVPAIENKSDGYREGRWPGPTSAAADVAHSEPEGIPECSDATMPYEARVGAVWIKLCRLRKPRPLKRKNYLEAKKKYLII
ncbi:hypothetical protein EVAR_26434_1 [Eumeta japonica]|uniref:Uncharacterized protein n=1 Tax=Eumeta variegata TaxID=151549 RepID=A0A4C1VQE7_EUMVA|nr:hypothetical protein EVAR_26434_1 [Eumeta japonica]